MAGTITRTTVTNRNPLKSASNWFDEILEESRYTEEFQLENLLYILTEEFHRRLKETGLTQRELARRLNVSDAYVSKLLSGKANMSLKTLIKLSTALGLQVEITFKKVARGG